MRKWYLVVTVIFVNGVWNKCIRDLRISQIYEGTNGVQSQDLIGRKTIKCGGAFIAEYIAESVICQFIRH